MFWLFIKYYLMLACVLLESVNCFDYCSITCGGKKHKHTMCKYPKGGGPQCKGNKRGLSKEEKQFLLDRHNGFRQQVAIGNLSGQPPASNMMEMHWDDDAARTAQRWAEQCKESGHDICKSSQHGESGGQNVAAVSGLTGSFNRTGILHKLTNVWFKEHANLVPANFDKFLSVPQNPRKPFGHYTQVVWAGTSRIGCGLNDKTFVKNKKKHTLTLVCNYFTTGNLIGSPTYKKGKACSSCPDDAKCSQRWHGLCTSDKQKPKRTPDKNISDGKIQKKKNKKQN